MFLSSFPKVCLYDLHYVCVLSSLIDFVNVWTNLYETWYVYRGSWTHLGNVLHKSLPSVCVSVCSIFRISLQGNGSVKTFPPQLIIVGGVIFYALRVIRKQANSSCKNFFTNPCRQLLATEDNSVVLWKREVEIYQLRFIPKVRSCEGHCVLWRT
jgi:hypothetical protein